MKNRRLLAVALILLLLAGIMAGCSSNSSGSEAGGYYGSNSADNALSGSGSGDSGSTDVLADRKLIRRVSITAETEEMDAFLADLNSRIASFGGYIESRNIQNGSSYSGGRSRYATLVIRIPAVSLDSFLQQVSDTSNVVSTVEESDDVTLQYVSYESRLGVLRTEEARLLEFLSEAKTVSEMLEIEARLTEVQSEIETIVTQLNTYDNLVDYGTVTLTITEVEVYTQVEAEEPTMWEEIAQTFQTSIETLGKLGKGLVVYLVGNSPYFLLLGAVALVFWLFVRFLDRKSRRRKSEPPKSQ